MLEWLVSISKVSTPIPLLLDYYREFYPTVFDPLDLKEAKLYLTKMKHKDVFFDYLTGIH